MKPFLVIDLNGALMRSRPFDSAHRRWFALFASLLNDPSINRYSELKNYFPKVHEVMGRYLGDVDEQTKNLFARQTYAMATLAEVQKEDLVKDFVVYLRAIKSKYSLALVTSAPSSCVDPLLEKLGCVDLFGVVIKSPEARQPSKKELLEDFVKLHGKPAFYIGNGDKDILSCKELGIKTISVNWVSKGKFKGDYDAASVAELGVIL